MNAELGRYESFWAWVAVVEAGGVRRSIILKESEYGRDKLKATLDELTARNTRIISLQRELVGPVYVSPLELK